MAVIELVQEQMPAATGGAAPKISEEELPAEGEVTLSKAAADDEATEAPAKDEAEAEAKADDKDEAAKE